MEVLGLDEVGSDGLHSSQEDGDPGVCTNVGVNSFFFLLDWFIIALENHLCARGKGRRRDGQVWAPSIWGLSKGRRQTSLFIL